MSLKNWSLAAITALLVAPLSASALGIVVESATSSGGSNTVLQPGDTITFNLRLENPGTVDVFALGIGAYGYDENGIGDFTDNHLQLVGGTSSQYGLGTSGAVVPTIGVVGNGLENSTTTAVETGQPFPIGTELRTTLFNAVSSTAVNGDGNNDIGIGLGTTGPGGDVHIQVTFLASDIGDINPGEVTIEFGTGQFGNEAIGQAGAVLPFSNASWTLTVIPEPGTALLMGLGLAGLASTRRR